MNKKLIMGIDKPSIRDRKKDIALFILRIVFGGLMIIEHGIPKAMNLFGTSEIKFYDFIGLGPKMSLVLAVFAELICAAFVVIGLMTRLASIPIIFTMLVANFVVHFGDPLGELELGLLYLGAFVSIFYLGGGKYSIDEKIVGL
jgi:putative oxidoreductase